MGPIYPEIFERYYKGRSFKYLKTKKDFKPSGSQSYRFMDFYYDGLKILFISEDLYDGHFEQYIGSLVDIPNDNNRNRWGTEVKRLLNEFEIQAKQ